MGGTPAQSVKCKSILILQSAENSHTGSVYAVFHCSNTVGTGQPTLWPGPGPAVRSAVVASARRGE